MLIGLFSPSVLFGHFGPNDWIPHIYTTFGSSDYKLCPFPVGIGVGTIIIQYTKPGRCLALQINYSLYSTKYGFHHLFLSKNAGDAASPTVHK